MLCCSTNSLDWSILSSRVRDSFSQSMFGLAYFSQGRPSIIFSFPQLMTKKRTFWVILPIRKKRGATKRILPLAFTEPSAFLRLIGFGSRSVGMRFFLTNPQSMQETSAPESTLACVLTTRRVCSSGRRDTEIRIDRAEDTCTARTEADELSFVK